MAYVRVLPRDLFNESNLLKCLGRLWIILDETHGHNAKFITEDADCFEIDQSESSGCTYVRNIDFEIAGEAYSLTRPLNARSAWPLYAVNCETDDETSVFDNEGNLSADMRALIGL